jgi:hypothetical protein
MPSNITAAFHAMQLRVLLRDRAFSAVRFEIARHIAAIRVLRSVA